MRIHAALLLAVLGLRILLGTLRSSSLESLGRQGFQGPQCNVVACFLTLPLQASPSYSLHVSEENTMVTCYYVITCVYV